MDISLRQVLLTLAGLVLVIAVFEGIVLSLRARAQDEAYDWASSLSSMFIAIARQLSEKLPLALVLPGGAWLYEHRLMTIAMDSAWAWIALFFGVEFFYYWFHRAAHRVRWFWISHSVHHTANQFNLSAAFRLSWTARLAFSLVFFVPLIWIGFAPQAVLAMYAMNLLYQFWIHAQWIPKLGFLEGWINTPSAHRIHHASNLDYLDANYGGVLMVFDRIFGTYIEEKDGVPIRYGWVEPLRSKNPFVIVFSPWVMFFKDLLKAKSLRDVLGYVFAPPGWAPNGQGRTTEDLRRRAANPTLSQ